MREFTFQCVLDGERGVTVLRMESARIPFRDRGSSSMWHYSKPKHAVLQQWPWGPLHVRNGQGEWDGLQQPKPVLWGSSAMGTGSFLEPLGRQ